MRIIRCDTCSTEVPVPPSFDVSNRPPALAAWQLSIPLITNPTLDLCPQCRALPAAGGMPGLTAKATGKRGTRE